MRITGLNIALGLTISIMGTIGYAIGKVDLVEKGIISIDKNSHENVKIQWVEVSQEDENLVISGHVLRKNNDNLPIRGHVDLIIIGPSGEILKKVGTNYFPKKLPRRRAGTSSFKISVPLKPPHGSRIRTEFHNSKSIPADERVQLRKND